jgi:hypothetical protein
MNLLYGIYNLIVALLCLNEMLLQLGTSIILMFYLIVVFNILFIRTDLSTLHLSTFYLIDVLFNL